MFRKILGFIGEYFVVIGGLGFIFGIGVLYAFIKVDSLILNLVFICIAAGWIIFLIKYFWDLLDKK